MPSSARPRLGAAVQLFATCIIEHVRPQVGLAAVRVLERLGITVEVPAGQTCCGQPAFNAGARAEAAQMARQTIDVLNRTAHPIVIPSGSCTDMIVHQYPALLAGDPVYSVRAEAVAARTWEFSEAVDSLRPVLGQSNANAPLTYHPSCHLLRGLQIKEPPTRLLDGAGMTRVELPGAEECCGFGGLFSIKMSDISSAMLARKLDNVDACGARTLVACDSSCLLHLEGGLRKRGASTDVKHLAEILDTCGTLEPAKRPEAAE
jgi:L-lactate dehydrogenase complex protein LldE